MSSQNFKSSMKDKKQKQDVLKAILNVKKYAKNLKKNADTYYQRNINDQFQQITSSPSFFDHPKSKFNYEVSQPSIKVESLSRQTTIKNFRQKKQHSMTSMPSSKKQQYSAFTKLKKDNYTSKQPSEVGSYREGSYSMKSSVQSRRQILSQSYRGQNLWSKIMMSNENEKQIRYIEDSPYNSMNLRGKRQEQNIQKQKKMNPEVIRQLIEQIKMMKKQLGLYQSALIAMNRKYIDVENKAKQKIHTDHLVDILKAKIDNLECANGKLNRIIVQQNQQIQKIGKKCAQSIQKIVKQFQQQSTMLNKLQTQNCVLKKLLNLKYQQYTKQICQYTQNQFQNAQLLDHQISESDQISICINVQQFQKKYQKIKNQD